MPGDYYVTAKAKEKETTVSEDQKSSGVTGNIRKAILKSDPHAYDGYFGMIQNKKPDTDTIPLHHSFGDGNSQNGYVFSFNVAGSSYAQPLRYEKGSAGKDNILLQEGSKSIHIKKGEKGSRYTFVSQNGVKISMKDSQIERESMYLVNQTFGEGGVLGKKDIRIMSRNAGRKVKYSISGPESAYWASLTT